VSEPTLYLFDGWNLLHAGAWRRPEELIDALASFVALRGARGVLVFDGAGRDERIGPLQVRFAADADALLERLAAEHRGRETVAVVSSDFAIRGTTGQEVRSTSSRAFLAELERVVHSEDAPRGLAGRLDAETLARLERLRRGE
jgi:predicted RNA-binding protein with PIN domain